MSDATHSALILAEKALAELVPILRRQLASLPPLAADHRAMLTAIARVDRAAVALTAIQAALRNHGQGWSVEDEREACAKIVDDAGFPLTVGFAIRARRTPSPIPGLSEGDEPWTG